MTRKQKDQRDLNVAKYFANAETYNEKGIPVYPTWEVTALTFNISVNTLKRIKDKYVNMNGVERNLKEQYARL